MLSGHGGFVKSDIPELQTELDAYFNENESFVAELSELLVGAVSTGYAYMYAYKDESDRTAFQAADSIGVVEVREKETEDKCAYVIYWYIDRIGKDNKKVKRIQVWDNEKHIISSRKTKERLSLTTASRRKKAVNKLTSASISFTKTMARTGLRTKDMASFPSSGWTTARSRFPV